MMYGDLPGFIAMRVPVGWGSITIRVAIQTSHISGALI